MKKVVIAPDSFKGTMSSVEICDIAKNIFAKHAPACEVVALPIADGGEGSIDCFLSAIGGEKIYATVKGPHFEDVEGYFAVLSDGKTAVVETAVAAGLPLAQSLCSKLDPSTATTYGVGQLIALAATKGYSEIIIGLGGSCTNDGGAGAAAAIGVKFFDKDGAEFIPVGATLSKIASIDTAGVLPQLKNCKITAMCDVDNPLYGPAGAAFVFAAQKGADADMIRALDENLKIYAARLQELLGQDVASAPGAGAAGGLGAGMLSFFGAQLRRGIDAALDAVGFEEKITGADMVITGEGKLDSQSLRGKTVVGISRRAKKLGVPVVVVAGNVEADADPYSEGVSAVFSTNLVAEDFSKIKSRGKEFFTYTLDNIVRLAVAGENFKK